MFTPYDRILANAGRWRAYRFRVWTWVACFALGRLERAVPGMRVTGPSVRLPEKVGRG